MSEGQVTMWQLPQLLLELVPETQPLIAERAVQAWDTRHYILTDHGQYDSDALLAKIGSNMPTVFDPYNLAGWIFFPVFEEALNADPLDEDLVRRCCEFVEHALSGEEFAAEGVNMMVIDNFGPRYANRVLAFAGPKFLAALRSMGYPEVTVGLIAATP